MKKSLTIIIVIISIIVAHGVYKEKSRGNNYISLIGLNVPKKSKVIEFSDSHGGFHGDGVYYEVIQLDKEVVDSFTEDAINTGSWERLPMGKDLRKFIYGEHTSTYSYGGYGENIPDDIYNGVYYFKDRYRYDTSRYLFDRLSQNFNFAILDVTEGRLYIIKYDS